MNLRFGDPPKWLIQAQRNDKYLFRIALVGQWLWAEIACWKTKKGNGRGWAFEKGRIKGCTPWASFAIVCRIG